MTPKHSPADVVAIREAVAARQSRLELAGQNGLSHSHVERLVCWEMWRSARGPITRRDGAQTNTGYWRIIASSAGNRSNASIVSNGNRRTLGSHRDPETASGVTTRPRAAGFPAARLNFPDE